MFGAALGLVARAGWAKAGTTTTHFIECLILLNFILPISLRTILDMVKVYNAGSLSKDTKMPGAYCRNSSIPEELGSIEFLFTDKTGTLTKNEMLLKKLAVGNN